MTKRDEAMQMLDEMETLLKEDIDDAPTIDAVPVVRCKDCKYGDELCGSIICLYHNADGNYCEDGGFCAWGERRTDGND